MNPNEELKILMVALRGIGKTSLLAAMHEEFDNTFKRANLQTWTDDNNTLRAIEECKSALKNIDPRLKNQVTPTQTKENPWSDQGFFFEIGSEGKKFMRLRFTDPSGEYFNPHATQDQKEYIKWQLNNCDAMIIPVDATALMQKKTGRVTPSEIGIWHEEKNCSQRITQLIKEAYSDVMSPRIIILAPVKCETYTKNSRDAEKLLAHVKLAYSELLDFLKSDSLLDKVAVVITPVQTIGNVTFAHHKTDENGLTKFFYYKTPINAPYEPKDGDQPLRYTLSFLINVFLADQQKLLAQEQKNYDSLKEKLGNETVTLEEAERQFQERKRLLEQRKSRFWLWRKVANVFDDRETPFQSARSEFEQQQSTVNNLASSSESSLLQVQATQEQIKAFNNALFKFAMNCKNNDGFAIVQGHKWFEFHQSIF
jgi:GTPase SAR1 family protein